MAITAERLAKRRPKLFHMAAAESWPSIRRHGLLGTSALLDLFDVGECKRERLERCHRPESVTICHPKHGRAVIRDQKPMSDKALCKALPPDMRPGDWYKILNAMVFFWLDECRLEGMLKAYKTTSHIVLIVSTKSLLEKHKNCVFLSPINSGYTRRKPACRDRDTFYRIGDNPSESCRKGPPVELAVEGSVPDICRHVICVEKRGADGRRETIWRNRPGKNSCSHSVE